MIQKTLKATGIALLVIFSAVIFIAQKTLLAFPFNQAHLIFIILTFLLFFTRLSVSLWYCLIVALILELYALTPFGFITSSMMVSTLVGFGVFQRFFTNFSFFSLLATLFIMLLSNQFFMFVMKIFLSKELLENTVQSALLYLWWEFILSMVLMFIAYIFVRHFFSLARPEYIQRRGAL